MFVTGLVLAAGGSSRLGRPKQLLPFGEGSLLGATLDSARACAFDQLVLTVGGAAPEILDAVDLRGTQVVHNEQYTTGCSSSIAAALDVVDPAADGIVLLLGDQPRIRPGSVRSLVAHAGTLPLGVCRYRDGRGHPIWLGRGVFEELRRLHGDKGVWRLLDSARFEVAECPVDETIPRDVDTWDDYRALLAEQGAR